MKTYGVLPDIRVSLLKAHILGICESKWGVKMINIESRYVLKGYGKMSTKVSICYFVCKFLFPPSLSLSTIYTANPSSNSLLIALSFRVFLGFFEDHHNEGAFSPIEQFGWDQKWISSNTPTYLSQKNFLFLTIYLVSCQVPLNLN